MGSRSTTDSGRPVLTFRSLGGNRGHGTHHDYRGRASERDLTPLHPAELLELALGLCGVNLAHYARLEQRVASAPMVRGNKWQLARVLDYALQDAVSELDPARANANTLILTAGTDARGWAEIRVAARGSRLSADRAAAGETPRPTSVSMALAEQVVAGYGGKLIVHEQRDERMVELRLPPMRVPAVDSETPAAIEVTPRRGSLLVIDDEPLIGRVLEISLSPHHDVRAVQSAQSALALLERSDAFDVILCDLSMPSMSGQDFYERLREIRPSLAKRVIIMTGGACDERGARFIKDMAGRCLYKPFSTEQLLPLIAERMHTREGPPAHLPC